MSVSVPTSNRDELLIQFQELRPMLLAIANAGICRDIRSKIGASDIVQQTMIEAFEHVNAFQPVDDRHLFNWLSKILLHNLKDVSRSFRLAKKRSINRERRLPRDANLPDTKTMDHSLEAQEEIALLSSALTRLPQAHQQILKWRYHHQMTFPEIAELVGRSEDAVRMQVKRAIDRLSREMNTNDHPQPQ